jgi:calcium/calmodulin-dependent protein kinase I
MQEDDDVPGQSDVPADAQAAAGAALSGEDAGADLGDGGDAGRGKRSLSNIAKGAIFREVVLAKVREAKEAENALQVEKQAQDKAAKRNSTSGN